MAQDVENLLAKGDIGAFDAQRRKLRFFCLADHIPISVIPYYRL
jgi:hypothetical protein